MLLILVVCETIYCLSHRVTLITGPVLLSLMGLSPHPSLTWLCIYNYHSWKCGFFPHDSVDHSLIWLHIHIPHKRFFFGKSRRGRESLPLDEIFHPPGIPPLGGGAGLLPLCGVPGRGVRSSHPWWCAGYRRSHWSELEVDVDGEGTSRVSVGWGSVRELTK